MICSNCMNCPTGIIMVVIQFIARSPSPTKRRSPGGSWLRRSLRENALKGITKKTNCFLSFHRKRSPSLEDGGYFNQAEWLAYHHLQREVYIISRKPVCHQGASPFACLQLILPFTLAIYAF